MGVHAGSLLVGAPGSGWRIAGVGDLDGDGVTDLLWQRSGEMLAQLSDSWLIADVREMDSSTPGHEILFHDIVHDTVGRWSVADSTVHGTDMGTVTWTASYAGGGLFTG